MLSNMSAIDQLIRLADVYANAVEVEPVTVSWRVFNDSKKLHALQHGADIQVRRAEAAIRWFSENWPPGVKWPREIPRPVAEGVA
jgi:hypothetical protein